MLGHFVQIEEAKIYLLAQVCYHAYVVPQFIQNHVMSSNLAIILVIYCHLSNVQVLIHWYALESSTSIWPGV